MSDTQKCAKEVFSVPKCQHSRKLFHLPSPNADTAPTIPQVIRGVVLWEHNVSCGSYNPFILFAIGDF